MPSHKILAGLGIGIQALHNGDQAHPKPYRDQAAVIPNRLHEKASDENAKNILLKAHSLALEKGTPYFTNMTQKGNHATFSASGCKFEADLTNDWETDTLRTGCLGYVTVNLPRIVHESERDKNRFFEIEIGSSGFVYDINMDLIRSKEDVVQWISHLREKNWCTDDIIRSL